MASRQTRITAKLDEFNRKMRELVDVTGRVMPTELNRQLLMLVVGQKGAKGLVQLTQKATEERITSDLQKPVTYRTKGGQAHSGPLLRVLAIQWLHNRGSHLDEGTIAAAMNAILKARIQSRAYIAASWLWAAQKMATKVPGNTLTRLADNQIPTKANGTAYDAFQKSSTASKGHLRATVFNTARGADIIAAKAIPRALGNANRSMGKFIQRQWGKEVARKWHAAAHGY